MWVILHFQWQSHKNLRLGEGYLCKCQLSCLTAKKLLIFFNVSALPKMIPNTSDLESGSKSDLKSDLEKDLKL